MQGGAIYKGSGIVPPVKLPAMQKIHPKIETAFDMLKQRAFRVAIGGCERKGIKTFAQELALLPEDAKKGMYDFLRIKRGEIFAKAAARLLSKNPNANIKETWQGVPVPYGLMLERGLLDAAMLERIDALEGMEIEKIHIRNDDFECTKERGELRAYLKVPYFSATGELAPDMDSLKETFLVSGRAVRRLRVLSFLMKIVGNSKNSADFYCKDEQFYANHNMRDALSQFYSSASIELGKMRSDGKD